MAPLSLKVVSDEGAVTRTVKFESGTKVVDACAIIREKFLTAGDGKEYALFLQSADEDRSGGVWLEPHRTLEYYMLRDGDSVLFLSKLRNLRIRMLDDSLKTLQVDESKNIGELMITICGKIGITNHDEYGLCHEEEEDTEDAKDKEKENKPTPGTLTMKRKVQPRERDTKMEMLSKKLKTDDNVRWLDQHRTLREQGVGPTVTVLLKRRLFFSDRNVDSRDPVQLNLLYVQTRDAILNGRHPVTENQARDCKVRWSHIRDVYRQILKKAQDGKDVKLYKYHKDMAFLRPHYGLDESKIEFDSDDNEDDSNDVDEQVPDPSDSEEVIESEELEQKPFKRQSTFKLLKPYSKNRVSSQSKIVASDELPTSSCASLETPSPSLFDPKDPVDTFLLGIGATLKRLTPYHLNLAKSKIFSVVQEHELEMLVQNPQN